MGIRRGKATEEGKRCDSERCDVLECGGIGGGDSCPRLSLEPGLLVVERAGDKAGRKKGRKGKLLYHHRCWFTRPSIAANEEKANAGERERKAVHRFIVTKGDRPKRTSHPGIDYYKPPSRTPRTSLTVPKSARKGQRSVNSVS